MDEGQDKGSHTGFLSVIFDLPDQGRLTVVGEAAEMVTERAEYHVREVLFEVNEISCTE
jgi:hypothetical protein